MTLRDSPCGDTSNGATVAVMTCDVSLLMEIKNNIFLKFVAELHVLSQLGCQSLTYSHVGCCATSNIGAHLVLASLVALLVVCSECHIKKDSTFFLALNAETSFLKF